MRKKLEQQAYVEFVLTIPHSTKYTLCIIIFRLLIRLLIFFQVKNVRPFEEKAHVSFLRKTQGGHYVYPAIEEESIVLFGEIEDILPELRFDRRGHFYFEI